MPIMKRDLSDAGTVHDQRGKSFAAKFGDGESVAKADVADSKGPAGIGVFGDFVPRNIREEATPSNLSTFAEVPIVGGPQRKLSPTANAIKQATGVVPQGITLPEAQSNIFKAFVDAEGRSPDERDSGFWEVVAEVTKAFSDAEDETVASVGSGEPMEKAADDDLVERFSKELDRAVPKWVTAALKETRTK
jgi:hypothetical protein